MDLNVLTMRHAGALLRLAWKKLLRDAPAWFSRRPAPSPDAATVREPMIDARELMRSLPVEGHIAKAEAYFSSLTDHTFQLAKPYASPEQAPALLIHFGTVLQLLRLGPGMRVLDFGAGTGWTSHAMSQMGAEVIVLDVSRSALGIAQELYDSHPSFGAVPAPSFLPFDGHHIDLEDASVDRILCFDAFHHAPNPESVLREFARVLRPGGIAAFSEPGPNHSRTPQSQAEMREYGVIEADVDIHEVWAHARDAGFASIELAAFQVPPRHLSLEGFDDLLSGGSEFLRWAEATRSFLHDVRTFALIRSGVASQDSRRTEGLAAELAFRTEAGRKRAAGAIVLQLKVTNVGTAMWLPSGTIPGGVALGLHLRNARDGRFIRDWVWSDLTAPKRPIAPGETVEVEIAAPPLESGMWIIEADLVADKVAWFSQLGTSPARIEVEVE